MMHASRPSGKLCIPAGRTNEFAFPWGNASPIAADRCRAAVDSGEILALQVLVCIPAVNYVMAPPGKPAGSGTARMDASKAAQMEEQIRKEQRIQQRATQWQREAGLLPPEPEVLTYLTSKAEPVSEPALMATVQGDPEAFMTLNLSRNLDQGMNPAYQLRDGFQTQSCMKSDFIWDQQEIDFMKRQGLLDKTFNRRRDEQSMYMEESCKFKHLLKRAGATAATVKA